MIWPNRRWLIFPAGCVPASMKTLECHQCKENVTENLAILVSRKEVILSMHNYKYCIVAIIAFVSIYFSRPTKAILSWRTKTAVSWMGLSNFWSTQPVLLRYSLVRNQCPVLRTSVSKSWITFILGSASGTVVQTVPNLYLLNCGLTSSQWS